MSHADKHAPDHRTPQELAKAILDHPLDDGDHLAPTFSFREILLQDAGTECEKGGTELVLLLKALEEGKLSDHRARGELQNALWVIDAYREESEEFKGMHETRAVPGAKGSSVSTRRGAEANAEDSAASLANLDKIEQLMRALAEKLKITLTEPKRGR